MGSVSKCTGFCLGKAGSLRGEMYGRRTVSIEMNNGGRLTAETYIVRAEYVDNLEEVEWDFSEFLRSGKSKFRAGYVGYHSITGED